MKITRRTQLGLMGSSLLLAGAGAPMRALAQSDEGPKTIEVHMLNKHPDNPREAMVFHPDLIRANPGDTIKFIATDKGHNTQSQDEMMPEGAEGWDSKINEDFEITLETEGTYGFNCKPHQTVGMVGLILVGDPSSNYEAAKEARHRGKAAQRFEDLFARADEMLASEESA